MIDPPTLAEPLHLSLADLDRSRVGLFTGWRRALGAVFDVAADPDEIGTFAGDLNLWATSRFAVSEITCSRVKLLRTPETITRSRIDHFAVKLLLSGSVAGLAGPTEVDAKAQDVFFIDLAQPVNLQTCVGGEKTASDVTLWIPRSRLLASVSDEHVLHGLGLKGTSPAGALVGASLRALAAQTDRMTVQEMDALASGVIQLTASAIAPILEATAVSGVPVPLASFVTVRRFIDRNLSSPKLGPDMIAKNFGLSRASLYRLFEPVGGIAGYIRKRRLNQVFQEITAAEFANQRIGQVANRFGFMNISAFSRLFRATYGLSPREAREANLKGMSFTTLKTDVGEGPSLGAWLANIVKS
jgi:AraC-like DNA-binding protein